jgi:pimeloyl-ACP methyl ester carboxylesterase
MSVVLLSISLFFGTSAHAEEASVKYQSIDINGVNIFYREAGSQQRPTLVLLHGFPTSSHMFRNLISELSNEFHLIAPDYPGFGNSDQPDIQSFEYSFDNLAYLMNDFLEELQVSKYSLYVMDYGAPIGYRIAHQYPDRVQALIIQNGNAYEEGLREFWDPIKKFWENNSHENAAPLAKFITPEGVKWQYTHGVRNEENISPDNWNNDLIHLSRNDNPNIQLILFYDYQSNVPLYPVWQEYFRSHQPPTLIVWGKNDYIFPSEGAYPYRKDLKNIDFHLLDTGHFALEEDGSVIAKHIRNFMNKRVL